MNKVQSKKLISELFHAIPDIWHGNYLVSDKLLDMIVKAEKQHRKGFYSSEYNFPIRDTGKYFAVKYLYDAYKALNCEGHLYDVSAILHIRNECLYAQAYVMQNKEKFIAWAELVKKSEFETLDYCELIK